MKLINGGGDVVSMLEGALDHAKSGEIVGVLIATLTVDGIGGGWAIRDGERHGWARMVAAAADLQHTLLNSDINGEPA